MGDVSNIVLYTTEMLICGILMVIFYYLQKVFFFKFGNDIVLRTKQKLYKKLNTVDIQFWNQYKVGDVLTILDNDIEKLQELLTSDISELVVNICLCIGISSYIIILNPKIGILVVVMSIIFAFIQRKVANKSKERMKKLRVTMGDFNSFSTETINNMPSLQMTGKTQYIKKMYADKCDELAKEGLDFTKTMCTVGMTGMSFNVLAIVIVLILGAVDVSNNLISVGLLFSMTIYVQRLYSPIVSIGNMFVKIKNFFPLLDNIYNVMFNEKNIIKGDYKHSSELMGNISFDNVWFGYNNERFILKGFTETFNRGEIIGIVGNNGSGKTTLVRLLTKLCTVERGKIEIDGIDINTFDMEYLQTQIGVMTQNSYLLAEEFNNILKSEKELNKMKKFLEEMNFYESGNSILKGNFEVKENNLNNVILYGGTNKVKEKLDEVGIFIMTSDFEGYPISTIEAMRRGLPIILRNTFEAAQDIVIDNGILLEKKWNEENFIEAVRKVYNNYKFYSENSIKQGKRYDLKKIENEWQNLMQNLENEKEY